MPLYITKVYSVCHYTLQMYTVYAIIHYKYIQCVTFKFSLDNLGHSIANFNGINRGRLSTTAHFHFCNLLYNQNLQKFTQTELRVK